MPLMDITHQQFDQMISHYDLVIFDFWAPWCEPCKAFGKTFALCAESFPDVLFAKVNVDEEAQLATDFAVRSIPMVMVLRERTVVFTESGNMPLPTLSDLVVQAQCLDMGSIKAMFDDEAS